jgi:nicotinamide-nucleotide amidase
VTVGDELLLGQTVDTNGAWLSAELSKLGVTVAGRWVVGDEDETIREAVSRAMRVADVVVVTGGLGPTPDDRTRPAVAHLLGADLLMDQGLLARLRERFRTRGYEVPPRGSEAMALIPRGARLLPNPVGTAPGLAMDALEGSLCVLLPGVPREMKGIFSEEVEPLLTSRYSDRLGGVVHRVIHTFGVPESVLMEELGEVLPDDLGPVSLAYLPDSVSVRLRLTARPAPGAQGPEEALARVESIMEPVLSRYRYEAKTGDLAEAVGAALRSRGEALAVAESCTGGLVSKRITDVPGSSDYFLGGVVAYENRVKVDVLGVREEFIQTRGVVSEVVAEAMATGVMREMGASVGVGVTGIAGPGGGSQEKPVGTVCYAVVGADRSEVRRETFLGDRRAIRERAAHAVLGLILQVVEGRSR